MEILGYLMDTKKTKSYICNNCNFGTDNKSNWNRHIKTIKHTKGLIWKPKRSNPVYVDNFNKFNCDCGKQYMNKSGLWKHRKTCNHIESESSDCNLKLIELLKIIMKQELTDQLSELEKKICTSSTTINNQFNIMVYLNQYCKNAINLSDFIKSIEVQLSDLEDTGIQGYAYGITQIISRNLNKLDMSMRPIQCSDKKREIIYVKDDDIWDKENSTDKITKAIMTVTNKNLKQLQQWIDINMKDLNDPIKQSQYILILGNAIGIANNGECDKKQISKIISNIAKITTFDKLEIMTKMQQHK